MIKARVKRILESDTDPVDKYYELLRIRSITSNKAQKMLGHSLLYLESKDPEFKQQQKAYYKKRVINSLEQADEFISCSELANILKLSTSSITKYAADNLFEHKGEMSQRTYPSKSIIQNIDKIISRKKWN